MKTSDFLILGGVTFGIGTAGAIDCHSIAGLQADVQLLIAVAAIIIGVLQKKYGKSKNNH